MDEPPCFRINEIDLEIMRDTCRDQNTLLQYENWIEIWSPLLHQTQLEIRSAFEDTELGDGTGLWEAQGMDDYATQDELLDLRKRDEKKHWQNIPIEQLNRCYVAPAFMNARGFVFHLPAFLIAELNDKHGYGFLLRLYSEDEHPAGWSKLLTPEQKTALIRALELVRAHPEYFRDRHQISRKIDVLSAA